MGVLCRGSFRCTQAYRLEHGEWKVILRHADELSETDEQQGHARPVAMDSR